MQKRRVLMVGANELRQQARRHEAAGRFERAMQCYSRALERQQEAGGPGPEPGLYLSLADLHFRQGEAVKALEYYRRAAECYRERGLPKNAESLHKMSQRLFPDRIEPLLNLALLYFELEEPELACGVLDGLSEALGEDPELQVSRKWVRSLVDSASFEARTEFREELNRRPGLSEFVA